MRWRDWQMLGPILRRVFPEVLSELDLRYYRSIDDLPELRRVMLMNAGTGKFHGSKAEALAAADEIFSVPDAPKMRNWNELTSVLSKRFPAGVDPAVIRHLRIVDDFGRLRQVLEATGIDAYEAAIIALDIFDIPLRQRVIPKVDHPAARVFVCPPTQPKSLHGGTAPGYEDALKHLRLSPSSPALLARVGTTQDGRCDYKRRIPVRRADEWGSRGEQRRPWCEVDRRDFWQPKRSRREVCAAAL